MSEIKLSHRKFLRLQYQINVHDAYEYECGPATQNRKLACMQQWLRELSRHPEVIAKCNQHQTVRVLCTCDS